MNNKILRNMSYGVYVVGTMDGDRPTGCVANSIMQITSSPATIAVSINHDNYTNSCIKKSGKFSFSILAQDSPVEIIGLFGFQSGKDISKFANIDYSLVEGVPVLKTGCGYVVCKVVDQMEASTHTVFLGEIIEADQYHPSSPEMTYAYYHNVLKMKSPAKAPTFLDETVEAAPAVKSRYKCTICGYIYEGDVLPDDFICPVCKQGADKFEKIS